MFFQRFRFYPDSYFISTSSSCYCQTFTCWKCIYEQSLLRKIWPKSGKDKKSRLYSSTLVIWSDFNPRPEEDNELTVAESGSEVADKMFNLEGRTQVCKILGCITTHRNLNSNLPFLPLSNSMKTSAGTVRSEMELSPFTIDQIIRPGHLKPHDGIF